MSENIYQIFQANPLTSNVGTDLFYVGQSPYGTGNDAAINFINFSAQFNLVVDQTTPSVTMKSNTFYCSDAGASLITFILPTASSIGDWIEIAGKGTGLWTIAQASGQQIHLPTSVTTLGIGGSLSSVNQYDCVRLRCITANTIWVVMSQQSSGLTVV